MNATRIVRAAAVWAAGSALLGGCGYTTESQFRQDVQTIAVPIFRRGTGEFRRDIEIRLTEAVVKHIEMETPYKVVDKSRADSLLSGTLNWAKVQPLSFDPRTGLAREMQVRLSLDLTWQSLRGPGNVLTQRKDFRVAADYVPQAPLAEGFFQGSEAAIDLAAQRIVEQLARPW